MLTLKQLTKQHIREEFLHNISLGIPIIAAWLVYAVTGFVATIMVARLGQNMLAASVVVNSVWVLLNVFSYGMFNAVSVLVSHQYGAENYPAIGVILRQAVWLALVCCFPAILLLECLPWALYWIAPTKTILMFSTQYAHALMWAVPGTISLVLIENFLNGIAKTKLALFITLIQVPFEIGLMYILVFGKFGVPAFGMVGVGYALAISYTFSCLASLCYFKYARFAQIFKLFDRHALFVPQRFYELFKIGFPIGLMYLIEVMAISTATFLMSHFGTVALAAQQLTMQFLGVTINIPYALGQAVSIRIGQHAGKQNRAGIYYATYVGLSLSLICMFGIASIYIFFPRLLLSLDLNLQNPANAQLIKTTSLMFVMVGIFQLFDSVRVIEVNVLRALKDTTYPMYISFICFWVIGLVCALGFGVGLHLAGAGIWLGLATGVAVGGIMLFFRMRRTLQEIDLEKLISK